jgi:hypothetical protein
MTEMPDFLRGRIGQITYERGFDSNPSYAVPVVALVKESLRSVVLPGRLHDPCEVDTGGCRHRGIATPDGRLNRESQGLSGGRELAGLMLDPAEAGHPRSSAPTSRRLAQGPWREATHGGR